MAGEVEGQRQAARNLWEPKTRLWLSIMGLVWTPALALRLGPGVPARVVSVLVVSVEEAMADSFCATPAQAGAVALSLSLWLWLTCSVALPSHP